MDVALVTGAASGLGLAIARKLIDTGLRVYGLGGNYADTPFSHDHFVPTSCDLTDPQAVDDAMKRILEKEQDLYAVVNNAKSYPAGDFEALNIKDLERCLQVNLVCPLQLARLALPSLRKLRGHIINVGATEPDWARGGPVGAASAGGLHWVSRSLFEQYRDMGVKVTHIFPQANRYRPPEGPPPPRDHPQSAIDAEAVADAVVMAVSGRHGNIVTEITIRPQRIIEKPTPAPLTVPAPPPKPIPRTSEEDRRTVGALAASHEDVRRGARERMERSEKPQRERRRRGGRRPHEEEPEEEEAARNAAASPEPEAKEKPSQPEPEAKPKAPTPEPKPAAESQTEPARGDKPKVVNVMGMITGSAPPPTDERTRQRRGRRKRRGSDAPASPPVASELPAEAAEPVAAETPEAPAKKASKKAARKSTKKAAAKKTAKKAAKKSTAKKTTKKAAKRAAKKVARSDEA